MDLGQIWRYFWRLELKKTRAGRKKLREAPRAIEWSRMYRLSRWIACTGKKRYPLLRLLERAEGGGVWKFIQRYSNEKYGETIGEDNFAFLLRYLKSIVGTESWPQTNEEFQALVEFINREFYPNKFRQNLRDYIFSEVVTRKLEAEAELHRRAGVVSEQCLKPLARFR
jgi:hypothetical protein